jgi:hypothetical protein
MVSIPASKPKSNLLEVSKTTFTKIEVHNNPQPDHYKEMWMHERNRRIEVEQENIRLRKMIFQAALERLSISIIGQIGRWM